VEQENKIDPLVTLDFFFGWGWFFTWVYPIKSTGFQVSR